MKPGKNAPRLPVESEILLMHEGSAKELPLHLFPDHIATFFQPTTWINTILNKDAFFEGHSPFLN